MDKDISTLLREIKDATGWSEQKIAGELRTSQPTVNRILKGQDDCKGSTLLAIVDLYEKHCSNAGSGADAVADELRPPDLSPVAQQRA